MHHMNKKLSPPKKAYRVSVPVDDEVLAVFERLSKAANQSLGKCIAQWLRDTSEAAEFLASSVERARTAPQVVMRELQAYALGITEETEQVMRKIAAKGEADRAASAAGGTRLRGVAADRSAQATKELGEAVDRLQPAWKAQTPPSCNTGGKLPKTIAKPRKGFPLPPALVQAHANTNGIPPKASK